MRKFILSLLFVAFAAAGTFAQSHGPVIPIDSVVYTLPSDLAMGNDTPAYFSYGDTITVEGVVTFDPRFYGLSGTSRKGAWLQVNEPQWAGLHVLVDPSRLTQLAGGSYTLQGLIDDIEFYQNFRQGLTVKVTGILDVFQGLDQLILLPIQSELTSLTPQMPAPKVVQISDFQRLNTATNEQEIQLETGEPYENMYVEFRNVTVVDVSSFGGTRWNWTLQDSAGNRIGIRDVSAYVRNDANADSIPANQSTWRPPSEGTKIEYVRGVIFQYSLSGVNQYSLAPLTASDIGPKSASPPFVSGVTHAPAVPTSTESVTVKALVTDDQQVSTAQVHYRVGTSGTVQQVNMVRITGTDSFTAQIPAQPDNSLVFYWVRATDADGSAAWSPDSLRTGNTYRVLNAGITSIAQIQDNPHGQEASMYSGKTINNMAIRAVVTSIPQQYDLNRLTVQDGVGPWTGIRVFRTIGFPSDSLRRGDSLLITAGTVSENFNVTEIVDATIQLLSRGNDVPAPVENLPIDSIIAGKRAYAEAYESVLLEFKNVYVVNQNSDAPTGAFGEWSFDDDTLDMVGLRTDDISPDLPENFGLDSLERNQKLDYLRGILYFSFGNWKLLPRNRSDIAGFFTPIPEDSIINIHVKLPALGVEVFPNPATDQVNVQFERPFNGTLQLMDISGRLYEQRRVVGTQVQLPLNGLNKGIYIIRLTDNSAVYTARVVVR